MNHIPVLQKETIHTFSYLSRIKNGYFVDGTLGLAGHSMAIASQFKIQNSKFKIIGIDKDKIALTLAKKNIEKEKFVNNFTFVHNDFKNIDNILYDLNVKQINGALLDLGVSSMQLDNPKRGFSFQNPEEGLDMRMDQSQVFSAKDIVNGYSKKELEKIIKDYGEERFAKKIAENIVAERKLKPIKAIGELLQVILKSLPSKLVKTSKINPATKTFQALRIEVNHELEGLGKAIEKFVEHLSPHAKLAVISFHSLEDRIVKNTFKKLAHPCHCPSDMPCVCNKMPVIKILTKKPIIPSFDEITINPRSRSAKLRIAEKL